MAKRGTVGKKPLKEKDERPIRWRKYPYLFLIVCEDQKTEPYYFETFIDKFPEETVFLRAVGTGRSSKGVVEQAVQERYILSVEANKDVDEVWAVFDKDDAEKTSGNTTRFLEAFEIAREENIHVAYSNEVFELWLLLHFEAVTLDKPIPRAEIYTRLNAAVKKFPSQISFEYTHGRIEVIDAIQQHGNEKKAIDRASKLLEAHTILGNPPMDANPSTRVHILVGHLRELIDYYAYTPE